MSVVYAAFALLPDAVKDKLCKAKVTSDRVQTWARITRSRSEVLAIAFDLESESDDYDFYELVDLLWKMVPRFGGAR